MTRYSASAPDPWTLKTRTHMSKQFTKVVQRCAYCSPTGMDPNTAVPGCSTKVPEKSVSGILTVLRKIEGQSCIIIDAPGCKAT